MKLLQGLRSAAVVGAVSLLAACATPQGFNYSAYRQSKPASLLVLPPLNDSPDVDASYSVYSHVTAPLAESGYYVLPVALVDEMFRQNGYTDPGQIHEIPIAKLREVFGADAAIYIKVSQYGTTYSVITSESRVTASARMVDLRSGELLWEGSATASSAEGRNSNGGLIGMLLQAVVSQIAESVSNRSHIVAATTSSRLLSAHPPDGLLYGPRSPKYGTD